MRPFEGARRPTGMSGAERTKLIAFAAGAIAIAVAIVATQWQLGGEPPTESEHLPAQAPIELPELPAAELAELVADRTADQRVRLERAGVDLLQHTARRLTRRHYEAMDTPVADAALLAAIAAEPAAWRARPLSLRGRVLHVRTRRPAPDREDEHRFLIAMEDGARAHGLASRLPRIFQPGDWVRLDGLVLKVFNDEFTLAPGDPGEWVEAPLVVGWSASPSSPPLGPRPTLDPAELAGVRDDGLDAPGDLNLPERDLLLAHARDLPPGQVDWSAAPELDAQLLADLLADPAPHRGRPFRLPVSQLQAVRWERPGENPARLEAVSELWIGNANWDQRVRVIHVQAPWAIEDLDRGDLLTARLLFLKNFAYVSRQGSRHVTPFFVAAGAERFVAPKPFGMRLLVWTVGATTLILVAVLFLLARRDRRRSEEFLKHRIERRRARTGLGQGNPS